MHPHKHDQDKLLEDLLTGAGMDGMQSTQKPNLKLSKKLNTLTFDIVFFLVTLHCNVIFLYIILE